MREWVHLDVEEVVADTGKAMLLRIDGEEFWVPVSQISDPDDYPEGTVNATVSVSAWFASKAGLA